MILKALQISLSEEEIKQRIFKQDSNADSKTMIGSFITQQETFEDHNRSENTSNGQITNTNADRIQENNTLAA